MKSCLKSHPSTPPPTPGAVTPTHHRKCVVFCAEKLEQFFIADEWDRTPFEPCQKLSYQDVLEMKEIQRSLPRANQLHDPLSRRPAQHFLKGVPIGLLPLMPETASCTPSSAVQSPSAPLSSRQIPTSCYENESNYTSPSNLFLPCLAQPSQNKSYTPPYTPAQTQQRPYQPPVGFRPFQPPPTTTTPSYSSFGSSQHALPNNRPKPKFSFLPLLDTPEPPPEPKTFAEWEALEEERIRKEEEEEEERTRALAPPTPTLTNASLDSPVSRASTSSPDLFPSLSLPPPRFHSDDEDQDSRPITLTRTKSLPYFTTLSLTDPDSNSITNSKPDTTHTVSFSPVSGRPKALQTYTQLHGSTQGLKTTTPSKRMNAFGEGDSDNHSDLDLDLDDLEDVQPAPPSTPKSIPIPGRSQISLRSIPTPRSSSPSPSSSSSRSPSQSPRTSRIQTPMSPRLQPSSPVLAPFIMRMKCVPSTSPTSRSNVSIRALS